MGDWVSRALANIETQAAAGNGVQSIRAAIMQDGVIDAIEVRKLLSIHKSGALPSGEPDWNELLVEATVDYFAIGREVPVYQAEEQRSNWGRAMYRLADSVLESISSQSLADLPTPLSYRERLAALSVSEDDAALLIDALGVNGDVLDPIEIRILASLFARAASYPTSLRTFAWRALQATVLTDNQINHDEVGLIRAMVMGPASIEGDAVSRDEAEALFAMDKALVEEKKSDAWPEFFARAVGSHLLYEGQTPGRMDGAEQAWLATKLTDHTSLGTQALKDFIAKWDGQPT
jgi:hypothetical protein